MTEPRTPASTAGTSAGASRQILEGAVPGVVVRPDPRLAQAFITQAFFWMFIGLLVKLESRGPVLVREERYSMRSERNVQILRFRTRKSPADSTILPPPPTRIGAFLHEYGLDQLPELLNIWTGQLSLADPHVQVHTATDTDHDLHPVLHDLQR